MADIEKCRAYLEELERKQCAEKGATEVTRVEVCKPGADEAKLKAAREEGEEQARKRKRENDRMQSALVSGVSVNSPAAASMVSLWLWCVLCSLCCF